LRQGPGSCAAASGTPRRPRPRGGPARAL